MSNSNVTNDQLKAQLQYTATLAQQVQSEIRQHRAQVGDLERKCHQQEQDLIADAGRLDEARERLGDLERKCHQQKQDLITAAGQRQMVAE